MLEKLKFELEKKEKELDSLDLNTFIFNPNVAKLTKEIGEIKNKIKEYMEAKAEESNGTGSI